jgi:hypothetical protein
MTPQQQQPQRKNGFLVVGQAIFLFAVLFFLIAGVFRTMEYFFGECAYGNGERPVRTRRGYGTRSVRARMQRGAVDQKKLEATLQRQKDEGAELQHKKEK